MLCYARRFLLAPSLLLFALLGASADTSESNPTPKQIAQWVERLGDDNFKVREDATKKLWHAGAAAESALEKALEHNDREVARRARELLDKFHWGIYPDTPAGVVALIRAYQSSAGNPRLEVFQKLLESGDAGFRAVLKIAAAEKDENQRRMLGNLVANKLPAAFLAAVTEGRYEQFERLLEFGHEGKFIAPNRYAAYWLLRGQLPERIAHFAARLREHPDQKGLAQTLAYLHRANGDLVAALKAAEKSDRGDLPEGILYEMGDWKELAERAASTATDKLAGNEINHIVRARNPAEKWAYRAAYARLAGKHKEFENAVAELLGFAESKTERHSLVYVAGKGLLLNGRPVDGIELLRTVPDQRLLVFEILCSRLEFAAALELADKAFPNDKESHRLYLARARLLCLLGDKEGEASFERDAERIKDGVDPEWVQLLLREEMRAGLEDRAFAHAAKAMKVAPPKNRKDLDYAELLERFYVAQLFPTQTTNAQVWWTVLRRREQFQDDSSPATVLKRLRKLLKGQVPAKDVKAWIEADRGAPPQVVSSTRDPLVQPEIWMQSLAEAAILAGIDDLASSLLAKAGSRSALLRLGDLLAVKKQWDEAARRYQQAWKKELLPEGGRDKGKRSPPLLERAPYDPLPLYLAGDALIRSGRESDGKKLIEQAHTLTFTDAGARYNFIEALNKRGHKEAARRETELMLRVSEPNSFYANDAFCRLASFALARKDFLKAANDVEKHMLSCLQGGVVYMSSASYVREPAKIHSYRALGLLDAGKLDEALQHAERGLAIAPSYLDLPVALVPELERRGHKKEATDLFNRCYGAYEKVCRTYPRCAMAHNQAAWLSACCRRNLDAALGHAQKAVELAPNYAGYLDTLAEVHFQRGDKDKAVALQRRAIELNPKRNYYRKQLQRLEVGDPSAERPPEIDEE